MGSVCKADKRVPTMYIRKRNVGDDVPYGNGVFPHKTIKLRYCSVTEFCRFLKEKDMNDK